MAKAKVKEPEIEFSAKLKGAEEWHQSAKYCKIKNTSSSHGTAGALYFAGFIGSMVYWMQAAEGFGAVVTGLLKSLVWPAYIVYKLLESFYGVVN